MIIQIKSSNLKIIFTNLNYLHALPTLITALASLGLQAGEVVQDRSLNQGLFCDKGPQYNFSNTIPNQVNNIPFRHPIMS
jgi:hypothetical protein